MSGGSNIRAVGPDDAPVAQGETGEGQADEALALTEEYIEDLDEEPQSSRGFRWVLPLLAIIGMVAWTGFYLWAHQAEILAGGTPQQWSGWIVAWAIPTLLLATLWLLAMRTSRREALRFGEIANMLSGESAQLEARLSVVNRELSMAREFLASQARDLDSLGRVASDRLSEHADRLQALIHDNGRQIDAIATVSATALENMDKLRDDLPVIANSARDVSNQVGNAGRTAHEQLDRLVTGFERLNEFGSASERQVGSLQSRIDATIETFETRLEQLDEIARARFDALREKSEEYRVELDGREVEALAAIRRRAAALAEELEAAREGLDEQEEEALRSLRARLVSLRDEAKVISQSVRDAETQGLDGWNTQVDAVKTRLREAIDEIQQVDEAALASANRKLEALRQEAENVDRNIAERDARLFSTIAKRQGSIAEAENEAVEALQKRIDELDGLLAERRRTFTDEVANLSEQGEAVAARLWELRADMETIAEHGKSTEERLGANISALSERMVEGRDVLAGTDERIAALTESSVRLLELLQASATQSRDDLPQAISEAEAGLSRIREEAEGLRETVSEAHRQGADLSAYVLSAKEEGELAASRITALRSELETSSTESLAGLETLRASLAEAAEQSDALSTKAQGELRDAIAVLEDAARAAIASIEGENAEAIRALAGRIADQSGDALDRTLRERTAETLSGLDAATEKSTAASREAAIQLRDQLAMVNELAGNLEARVARARETAEEQVDNDFARRVALITESLNSNAIDIEKALTTDVTDTAWASYLRGDRGIFTRRAVRLLDNTEAREIAEFYDENPDFRDNVSRYIADFENMLRTLLSTRDGKALGVTMLSSDMGKLYVALAQAIERLRD